MRAKVTPAPSVMREPVASIRVIAWSLARTIVEIEMSPSFSARIAVSETDRITFSAARTVRRPNFDRLSPALLEEEFGAFHFLMEFLQRGLERLGFPVGAAALAVFLRLLGLLFLVLAHDLVELLQPVVQRGEEGIEGSAELVLGLVQG